MKRRMKRRMKKLLRNVTGSLLILAGIIFGPLPLVQGIALIVIGFAVLDFEKKHKVEEWLLRLPLVRRIRVRLGRVRERRSRGTKESAGKGSVSEGGRHGLSG